jgi:hypothetical protein
MIDVALIVDCCGHKEFVFLGYRPLTRFERQIHAKDTLIISRPFCQLDFGRPPATHQSSSASPCLAPAPNNERTNNLITKRSHHVCCL